MGRLRRSRTHKAQRDVHRASRTRVRTRDLDQIQLIDLDPKNRAKLEAQPVDYEKPGLAPALLRRIYYETDAALQSHWRSKVHKRRCKQLREPAYTIEEAERAAGLGRENKRRHRRLLQISWIRPFNTVLVKVHSTRGYFWMTRLESFRQALT
ncbi:hypothetical protein CPB84DRAFT_1749245 [Gymnopilus junonius]|uniref:Uncharacterized protein n=1 Tax=Gymnopilus junonius TaxID=109634 RepID=A0A9P5NKS2_GYMJU|nr:hypothetical protein CPB84DRAFT_1749245 [Gymnopilus junonius]